MRILPFVLLPVLAFLPRETLADTRYLSGHWVNADANTRGITRILILPGDKLQVFGKCHPSDCDWNRFAGRQPEVLSYGASVADRVHLRLTASYDFGFSTRLLTIRRIDSNRIQVDSFTVFRDRSGRQNTATTEQFVRR